MSEERRMRERERDEERAEKRNSSKRMNREKRVEEGSVVWGGGGQISKMQEISLS